MISFPEMLDAVVRLSEMLKSSVEVESAVRSSLTGLADLRTMLDTPRLRQFKTVDEIVEYIERVAVPQLSGLHDSLGMAAGTHFTRMRTARELASRLTLRLQALADGSVDGYLG